MRVVMISGVLALAVMAAAQEKDLRSVSVDPTPRAEALIIARCAVCHSTDLIAQQRLDREKWHAIVAKMRHWGAELTDQEAGVLVTYLSERYSPTAPDVLTQEAQPSKPFPSAEDTAVSGHPVGSVGRGATLFFSNCQACHGPEAKGGAGPKLSGNAILKDENRFLETVVYGRGAMPPWGAVLKPQEIADIHAWLQSLEQ